MQKLSPVGLGDSFVTSQILVEGQWVDGVSRDRLTDKFKGAVFGEMAVASIEQVDREVSRIAGSGAKDRPTPSGK